MAEVTFTITADIPVDKQTIILQRITDYLRYQTEIDGQPNPQTRKQFLEQKLKEYIKEIYGAIKANEGAETGRLAALTEAENEIK